MLVQLAKLANRLTADSSAVYVVFMPSLIVCDDKGYTAHAFT